MSANAQTDPNERAAIEASNFARRLVQHWDKLLGAELLGAYLMGSLAHGGFSRRYSDIDIALITETGLTTEALATLRSEAAALSADWGAKVSVFWTDRNFSCGRFPPLDRIDYLDCAVTLLERQQVEPARPTIEEVRHYLRGAPFASWADRARNFATAPVLARKDHKAYLKALLYPARFCYSWSTGRMGSNDAAVAYLSERNLPGLDLGSIKRALSCRAAGDDPDELFRARTILPSQVEACAAATGLAASAWSGAPSSA
ncbi:MAG TPA: nucleotidyltransferase domain-containing protein [Xanthobacteraceae bacterium]|nr:nucleotidyltransferase domain-containing protein [Xanthobacteraceae bacterium]